ncbi:MAG: histidinol-phosphate transaminase [Halioglobus sp.]|nr:histidinol-phosphate transaminase [Halioglobus sp.]
MSRYWTDLARALTPYVPGEQPAGRLLCKLNTNESPYPPSPAVARAIAAVSADRLRLYPDPESTRLRQAFAERYQLTTEQVFVGNGSDEVLAFAFMGLLRHPLPLCFPDVTYSFYPVWSALCDIQYVEVPVADDFSIDVDAFPRENGGIILPNPNAPTGRLLDVAAIRRLLERSSASVVVVDEAYIDFGGQSAAHLIGEYENLLVVQTLSKSHALAGLRVGVAMGSPALIEALSRIKNSFNSYPLDVLAQEGALASLADEAYLAESCGRVIASRERLAELLQALDFTVLPSGANFLFVTHASESAGSLFQGLRDAGVLVRHFMRPRIDNYLRITIGTDDDCDRLVAALTALLPGA